MPALTRKLLRHYQDLGEELRKTSLARARKRAENWRTGLVGLTALVGLIGTVAGPAYFEEVGTPLTVLGPVALGSAFLSLLAGSLLVMSAAYGEPDRYWSLADEVFRYEQMEMQRIRSALIRSRRLFVVGVLALAFAGAVPYLAVLGDVQLESSLQWVAGADGGEVVASVKGDRIPEGAEALLALAGVDGEGSSVVLAERSGSVGKDRAVDVSVTVKPERLFASYVLSASVTAEEFDQPLVAERVVATSQDVPREPSLSLQWVAGADGGEATVSFGADDAPEGSRAFIELTGQGRGDVLLMNHVEYIGEAGVLRLSKTALLGPDLQTLNLTARLMHRDKVIYSESIALPTALVDDE